MKHTTRATIDEKPDCQVAFEIWRDRASDDVTAGWSG